MYFGIVGLFFIINRYFEYRIRIRCIELYMGTWFKHVFRHFPKNQKMSQKCEQFSYGTFGVIFWGIFSPQAESDWLPKSLKFEISGRLFAEPKNYQKTHPFKTSQNLKKRDHGSPMARL